MTLSVQELVENGYLLSGLATTLALVRLSIDFVMETTTNVQTAIKNQKKDKGEGGYVKKKKKEKYTNISSSSVQEEEDQANHVRHAHHDNDGSDIIPSFNAREDQFQDDIEAGRGELGGIPIPTSSSIKNSSSLLISDKEEIRSDDIIMKQEESNTSTPIPTIERRISWISILIHISLLGYFITLSILSSIGSSSDTIYRQVMYTTFPSAATSVTIFIGIIHTLRDWTRRRFTILQRILYIIYTCIMVLGFIVTKYTTTTTTTTTSSREHVTTLDYVTLSFLSLYAVSSLVECVVYSLLKQSTYQDLSGDGTKSRLSKRKILIMLKPYIWPDATSSSAFMNRTRAILTWVCVILAKVCTLFAPILIGRASTAVIIGDFSSTVQNVCIYALLQFGSSFFKESQGLLYLKVAQEAFVQLSEVTFTHLHYLPMEWHLQKKLGEVIRSMDRGISACDTLMKYLFLWLVPAIVESVLVCVIFATYFNYFYLAVSTFYFVFAYIVTTIILALRRKKFRQKVNKSDNDWHDKCTESLVNFENVKYFTAEKYETKRFIEAVKKYQKENVNFQVALSALHVGQQFIFQSCLAVSLVLAANAIREGTMQVGDFVAVLSYTINLFQPLNYLARVYNQILTAGIDLENLSELLALTSDVQDKEDATELASTNTNSRGSGSSGIESRAGGIAIEFDNVKFHYPTQPSTSGLKGVSIQLKKGTTTAIVGTTGAGKTTIGRLLFRFYDTIQGTVRVNGIDVRDLTQQSLRQAIGVVPQVVTMFNDTIKANILYGKRDATDEELEKVCKDAQLWNFIQSLPDGWDSVVGDRGLKLSGGEKQRTAIARCLLKDPPIVLLDEATSSLDNVTEKSVKDALDILGTDRTCLIIAHRLGTIRDADNIIVLNDGVVIEEGNHDQLLQLNGKYADMWNIQLNSKSRAFM